MKIKLLAYFVILIFFAQLTSGVSSNLKNEYEKKETIIIEIYGNILQTIKLEDIELKKGAQAVGFEGDVRKLGDRHFLWLLAPQTAAEYNLVIKNIIEDQGNGPEVTEYSKKFNVTSNSTDYFIEPGVIFTDSNFNIETTLFGSVSKSISSDFPQQREINLHPGTNTINFDIGSVNGIQLIMINVGKYIVPAYIIGNNGPICGNGILESEKGEVCEGGEDRVCGNSDDNLNGNSCATYDFDSGNISCSSDCLSFEKTQCIIADSGIDENITESNSTNNETNGMKNETLNETVNFKFNPSIIQSTILFSSVIPSYFFEIFNYGLSALSNMTFEYDKNKFLVVPTENISIDSNSSKRFELRLINFTKNPIRGAIIARNQGGQYQFLLFTLNFTSNETEIKTEYLKNSSEEVNSYYCSELTGKICTGEEVCSGEEVKTLDGNCCLNECSVKDTGGGKSWIGYLIAAILVLILTVIYLKYKKAGKTTGGEVLKSRMISAEKSMQ